MRQGAVLCRRDDWLRAAPQPLELTNTSGATMDFVDGYLTGLEAAIHKLSRQDVSAVVEALLVAWRADRQIFVIGNGGSAATASHMMNDISSSG